MSEADAAPRRRRPDHRREEILAAARGRLLRQGVEGTRIDDIAADAGIAKGTFYLYFRDKLALVAALRERFVRELATALDAAVDRHPEPDWSARLDAWMSAAVRLQVERTAEHDLLFHDLRHPEQREQMQDNPVVGGLALLIRRGAAAGAWHARSPELLALLLFHAAHGAADSLRRQTDPWQDYRDVCATVVQWALNSLQARGDDTGEHGRRAAAG